MVVCGCGLASNESELHWQFRKRKFGSSWLAATMEHTTWYNTQCYYVAVAYSMCMHNQYMFLKSLPLLSCTSEQITEKYAFPNSSVIYCSFFKNTGTCDFTLCLINHVFNKRKISHIATGLVLLYLNRNSLLKCLPFVFTITFFTRTFEKMFGINR